MQTKIQIFITIALIVLMTMLTRFLPFLIFSNKRKVPKFVNFLGKYLPTASISLLVVYALRNVSFINKPYGLPELISLLAITFIHVKWRNTFLSIGIGTVLYMILVQMVF